MSIVFEQRGNFRVEFTDPVPLVDCVPSTGGGLYVVMLEDRSWNPLPFRPIYFGQAEHFSQRGFPFDHHAAWKWFIEANASPLTLLWISFHEMPGESEEERLKWESLLVDHYRPPCNGRYQAPTVPRAAPISFARLLREGIPPR